MNKPNYLAVVLIASLLIMTVYETAKQLLFGNISLYMSHAMTIVFTSGFSVIIANYLIDNIIKYQTNANDLRIYNEKVKNDLLAKEFLYAKELQASMIPSDFPLFPDRYDFDCYGYYRAAGYVGGDFYDIFFIDSHRIFFVIGDVSGKGIPAAILMTKCMNILFYEAQHHAEPADMLYNLNNRLSHNNSQLLFVTAFCAILDLNNGKLVYANAGHNPPIMIRNRDSLGNFSATPSLWFEEGNQNEAKEQVAAWHTLGFSDISGSLILGIKENFPYEETTTYMKPGEAIVMYTDGVTEAMNCAQIPFGEKRLMNCLASLDCTNPKLIVNSITSALKGFVNNDLPPSDDIAIFSLNYKGNSDSNTCLISNSEFCVTCVEIGLLAVVL